jgi:hypothetical protein
MSFCVVASMTSFFNRHFGCKKDTEFQCPGGSHQSHHVLKPCLPDPEAVKESFNDDELALLILPQAEELNYFSDQAPFCQIRMVWVQL